MGAERKKVFVTGANGQVGLPLVRRLVSEGHRVVGLARSERKAEAVRAAGAECLVGDVADVDVLARGAEGAAEIYHLAGGLRGAGRETAHVLNAEGTRNLVRAVERVGADGLETLLFTSTSAVYGDRSGLWVEEDVPPHPDTNYGRSKVEAERALLDSGLPVRIVRLSAVYGPGFPFLMADRIRRGVALLPGEGLNYVPTVHVDDAVEALVAVARRGRAGEVYHVADRDPMPTKDFYALVHREVGGRPVRFWSTWVPSYVQRRLAGLNERVQARLGRRPGVTPDVLALMTASLRLKVERLEKEIGFEWRWPSPREGVPAALRPGVAGA